MLVRLKIANALPFIISFNFIYLYILTSIFTDLALQIATAVNAFCEEKKR